MSNDVIEALREQVRGQVITAQDAGYEAARAVYNGMVDKHPLAVVQVSQVADVITTVKAAREAGLTLSLRGGGHNAAGFGSNDGGLVLDFGNRAGVRVDPDARRAYAEPGATWGDFNHATHAFGLATPGGIVGSTGIAGLTLGGGIGYLARKYGLSCDNLLSADVVLADGSFVKANEKENADLFWALRGGGGNFGVVTSFEYQLHPVDMVYSAVLIYPLDEGEKVASFYRDYIAEQPEEFGAFLGYHLGPPVPFLPEQWHGKPVVVVVGMWTGPVDEGEVRFKPLLDIAPLAGSLTSPMPYPALNGAFDPLLPKGMQAYWKADFLGSITDDVIRIAQQYGETTPSVETANHFYPIDGAVQRVAADATAFPYRDVSFSPVIAGMWHDPKDNQQNIKWVRDYWNALHEHSAPGGYINFMDADDQVRISDNFRGNYARLRQVKAKYDPTNLFNQNQNIVPA